MDWILSKLLSLEQLAEGRVDEWRVFFAGTLPIWLLPICGVLGIAIVTASYRQERQQASPILHYFLLALRSVAVALLIALLFEPTIELIRYGTLKNYLVMLVDTSRSMGIEDRRQEDAEIQRLARALHGDDTARRLTQEQIEELRVYRRLRVFTESVTAEHAEIMERFHERFRVQVTTFSDTTNNIVLSQKGGEEGIGWQRKLELSGTTTRIGRALRETASAYHGQPLAGFVLFSDGGHNHGPNPLIAAEHLRELGIPVYTVGVGLPQARDVELTHLFVEDVVFARDQIPVLVRIRSHGFEGRQLPLVLRDEEGQELATQQVLLKDGSQEVKLEFFRKEAGRIRLTAEIPPDEGELLTENNQKARTVRVIDDRIKVLFVEREPRWEYRYLKNAILRDYRMDLKILLRRGDETLARIEDSRFLREFPEEEKDLFPSYNVMVLGNVEASYFSSEQMELIKRFVAEKGAGLILIAGLPNNPFSYRNTALEDLFPVKIVPMPPQGSDAEVFEPITQTFILKPTPDGLAHPMMALHFDDDQNRTEWARLPGMYWYAAVDGLKPAATALAVHGSEGNIEGPLPLIALQRFGKGTVLYVGVDATWRWRFKRGDEFFYKFWNQAIKHLGMPHLLGEASLTQISTDRRIYSLSDAVKVYARVLDKSYRPLMKESIKAVLIQNEEPVNSFVLSRIPDKEGMYEGEFRATELGEFSLKIEEGEETVSSALSEFEVRAPQLELNDPVLNRDLLLKIAATTGGRYYEIDEIRSLPDDVKAESKKTTIRTEKELWDTWMVLLVFALLVSVEWVVRKWHNLS